MSGIRQKRQSQQIADANIKQIKTSYLNSPLSSILLSSDSIEKLRHQHEDSKPFKHIVIDKLCEYERMRCIHEEATNNFTATFKETDLFKVYQTGDLAAIDDNDIDLQSRIPNIISLKKAIYSKDFRDFVSKITDCGELTDRVDCSMNAYSNGGHLLCHDDVIGTRKVSYIIYFSDPDELWTVKDGGALELYPLEKDSVIVRSPEEGGIQGVPTCIPTTNLLPLFNSMAMFVVQPGRSYHSVQEVFNEDTPRLSISGWFHASSIPIGSDYASLQQIISTGDSQTPFKPLKLFSALQEKNLNMEKNDAERNIEHNDQLTVKELKYLRKYINPVYLLDKSIKQINKKFLRCSSIQLKNFLRSELQEYITDQILSVDVNQNNLGYSNVVITDPETYNIGCTLNPKTKYEEKWKLVGPTHKRRYLSYESSKVMSKIDKVKLTEEMVSNVNHPKPGIILDIIRRKLFNSRVFTKYVYLLTNLNVTGIKDEIRRFRPGLDYTVAHFSAMTTIPRLDATLCFVNELSPNKCRSHVNNKVTSDSDVKSLFSNDDDDDNLALDLWESGDVGGFECYIEADMKQSAEAAEVYRTTSADKPDNGIQGDGDGEESEESLLSVSAGNNVLNLVMRDENVMRFIKYISFNAPSSRWDISAEYELDLSQNNESNEDECEDDDEDAEENYDDEDDIEF